MVDPETKVIKVEPGLSSHEGSASPSTYPDESQYSRSTSGMVNPKTKAPEVKPGLLSLKRPYPGTSNSAKKKLKVSPPAQKSSQVTSKYISASDEAGLRKLLRTQAERRNKARKDNSTKSNLKAVLALNAIKSNSNPATKSHKINLSDMRQRSNTSASAKKQVKVPIKQEVVQKSIETAREDSPGFDEFLEKENLSYHVEEDNDVAPDSESEFDFEPDLFVKEDNDVAPTSEDNGDQLGTEDDNTKSNLNTAVASDIIKPNLNPTAKSNKINLSNLRQRSDTSASAKNKAKVIPSTDHNSTPNTHDDSDSDSGFEAYYEKEATTLDIEAFYDRDSTPEEDDSDVEVDEDEVDPEEREQTYDPDEDIFNSDIEDNVVESLLEDSNINSNDEDDMIENNSNLEDNEVENTVQPDPKNDTLEKKDLSNLTYAQLKQLCTDPRSRNLYGDEVLLTATMKACFNRMHLDRLDTLPRAAVPRKYHAILDQVIWDKTHSAIDIFWSLG
jgi:hypothetical protein